MHIITAWCTFFCMQCAIVRTELVDSKFFYLEKRYCHTTISSDTKKLKVIVQFQRAVFHFGHMINRSLEYLCNSFHPKSCIMIAHNCIQDSTSCIEEQYIAFGLSLQVKFA